MALKPCIYFKWYIINHTCIQLTFIINSIKIFVGEQNIIFNKITNFVTTQQGGIFFLHGHGGTRKTFSGELLQVI